MLPNGKIIKLLAITAAEGERKREKFKRLIVVVSKEWEKTADRVTRWLSFKHSWPS